MAHHYPRVLGALSFAGILTTAAPVAAQDNTRVSGVQGSFEPPLAFVATDVTYVFGTGLVVLAGDLRLFGVTAGAGRAFGSSPRPRLAFEVGLTAIKGGGEIGDDFPADLGGPRVELDMVQTLGSFTLKLLAVDPGEAGWLGLTTYAGASVGMQQTGITNALGTAYRHSLLGGVGAGAIVQLFLRPRAKVMAFAGGRVVGLAALPERGDKEAMPSQAVLTPEVGGNVTVHLPYGLDLTLSSLVTLLDRDDSDRETARVFVLGLGWRTGAGLAPLVDGGAP